MAGAGRVAEAGEVFEQGIEAAERHGLQVIAIIGLLIALPSFYWYWSAIPGNITTAAVERMPSVMVSTGASASTRSP